MTWQEATNILNAAANVISALQPEKPTYIIQQPQPTVIGQPAPTTTVTEKKEWYEVLADVLKPQPVETTTQPVPWKWILLIIGSIVAILLIWKFVK